MRKIKNTLKFNFDAIKIIRKNKWNWEGHIARINDGRWAYFDRLFGKEERGNRKKSRDTISKTY